VLGAERDIIANHIMTGQVKLVYWPMLDLGPNSENAAVAAFCAGEQDPAKFWQYHDALFEDQGSVYLARRGFFVALAAELGLDGPAFEACYDGDATRTLLEQLDEARREAGVSQRPTFDVNGVRLAGSQPYETFAEIIAGQLP
jgi:protein-disulfide isomerase